MSFQNQGEKSEAEIEPMESSSLRKLKPNLEQNRTSIRRDGIIKNEAQEK